MGNKNVQSRPPRGGVTLSTVGVDIGDWVYEKKVKGQNYGPVTFRSLFPSHFHVSWLILYDCSGTCQIFGDSVLLQFDCLRVPL